MNYSYDANGNLTSTTAGQSFSWDAFNRLTAASGSGGSVSYTYNGDGFKLRRTGPDGATVYYYDGIRPIWEADGAGTPKVQLDRDIFGNLLSRREVSSGVRGYFAHDGLGGLTGTTDEAGTHVASLFYDAWGNLRASGGTWTAGNYRFTGAELDSATGLYHMGARFYDPMIGRWLSEDLLQHNSFEPASLNFYVYVRNSPSIFIDPTGLAACDLECLNYQRQQAARLAGRSENPAGTYILYRELSREIGHERAMTAMFGESEATLSGYTLVDTPPRLSIAQIQEDYQRAVRFGQGAVVLAVGGIAALIGFFITGNLVLEGVADVFGVTAVYGYRVGQAIAANATTSDVYWWGGAAWRNLSSDTQRWLRRLRLPHP